MENILALSPLDGRYASKLKDLALVASEFGLIKLRVRVELEWFKFLHSKNEFGLTKLSIDEIKFIDQIIANFDEKSAYRVKQIEVATNHDVKAVEYFLQEQFQEHPHLKNLCHWIHFACTSEDINNISYALMLQQIRRQILLPQLNELSKTLTNLSLDYQDIAMVSRTHGQLATPTTLGKEVYNFVARINRQIKQLEAQAILAKLNGAVGNYNAHLVAFPEIVWDELACEFIEQILDLEFNPLTTQIEPHDYQAEFYDNLRRINVILIDLARDIWGYISLNYFKQKVIAGEVGSSTMPHKVNPIDFENAEGNFGIAISLLGHLAEKLPISRFQRDLSDSTVQRNIGVAIGYMVLGVNSLRRGLMKLEVNLEAINAELDNSWELLTEPIQTLMRRHGISDAYERLKSLSRGKSLSQQILIEFISTLAIPDADKHRLAELTPRNYLGLSAQLVEKYTNLCSSTKE